MTQKLFIILIKFIPIIQMVGMIFNNLLCMFNIHNCIYYIIDFLIGNSLLFSILLFIASYLFEFCIWHRMIILANLINIFIASVDSVKQLNITDVQLYSLYIVNYFIAILIITYNHYKTVKHERKIKNIKRTITSIN